jgi:hypothetical protein
MKIEQDIMIRITQAVLKFASTGFSSILDSPSSLDKSSSYAC